MWWKNFIKIYKNCRQSIQAFQGKLFKRIFNVGAEAKIIFQEEHKRENLRERQSKLRKKNVVGNLDDISIYPRLYGGSKIFHDRKEN